MQNNVLNVIGNLFLEKIIPIIKDERYANNVVIKNIEIIKLIYVADVIRKNILKVYQNVLNYGYFNNTKKQFCEFIL